MKRKIIIIALAITIIIETLILNSQNIKISKKKSMLLNELEENNLIINNEVSLIDVINEKQNLTEETKIVFKEKSADDSFKEQTNIGESLTKEIKTLEETIMNLEENLDSLKNEYNRLQKEYEDRNTFYITGVPFINQYPNYPTGCESVALTILLKYYGISITPDDIINALPKGEIPYTENGIVYGGNPEVEFIGTPYSQNSYGVYEKPLAEAANKFKSGINIATGTNFDDILKIVGSGKPVIVWTSMNLASPYISKSWIYKPTGETIYWKANEHAVVLIGYTPTQVIISDPIGGKVKYQSLSIFRERYNYYGKKALYY